MLGDDDLGILAQGVFDHLQLFEGLSIAHKVFLGSFIDQPDGLGLALSYMNRRFAFPLRPLDDRQLLLFGRFELTRSQQAHGTPLLLGGLLLVHRFLDVLGRINQADFHPVLTLFLAAPAIHSRISRPLEEQLLIYGGSAGCTLCSYPAK